MMVNLVLGLFLLDNYLNRKRKEFKKSLMVLYHQSGKTFCSQEGFLWAHSKNVFLPQQSLLWTSRIIF